MTSDVVVVVNSVRANFDLRMAAGAYVWNDLQVEDDKEKRML